MKELYKCRKDTIKIRILRTTHAKLKKMADKQGISMQELVSKLSTYQMVKYLTGDTKSI